MNKVFVGFVLMILVGAFILIAPYIMPLIIGAIVIFFCWCIGHFVEIFTSTIPKDGSRAD